MKNKIIKSVAAVLCAAALVAPFALTFIATVHTPAQYAQSFFAGLKLKRDRLAAVEGKRLVLIGGSNLAFGIDSALLEEYIGMPVVNFGLYAALGTKAMLDMAKPYINDGDIVLICPEEDAQTYSLYYNGLNMWYALDSDYTMLKDVGVSNYDELLAALPAFAAEKRAASQRDSVLQSGIYALSSLNAYGDISVERPYNTMVDFGKSMSLRLDASLVEDEFVQYLNDYARAMERKGAQIWFGFSPVNRLAVTSSQNEIAQFYAALDEKLDFPIISDINDYILDEGYFFDTNFHMNSVGMLHRTALLAEDICQKLDADKPAVFPQYPPPDRPDDWLATDTPSEDANTDSFLFEPVEGGVAVVGLSEQGLKAERLVLPSTYDSKAVVSIASEAFAHSTRLTTLVVPADASLRKLSQRAFAGCDTLVRVEVGVEPSLLSATELSFEGAAPSCRVYVSEDLFSAYASDYFWCGMLDWVEILE